MTAVFPQAPLDVKIGLQLTAGSWSDITTYAYQREGTSPPISIARGRPPQSAQANPSQATMQWNNRDGRFSRANPTGPYYGQFGRNTPVRISVPDSGTYLRIEDETFSYYYCADSTALQITGILDVRIDLELSGYQPCLLFAKWNTVASAWALLLNGDGTLTFQWWDGASTSVTSTAPLPNLGRIAIRAFLSTSIGQVVFQTAPAMAGPFTDLGSQFLLGATTLASGAGQFVQIGGATAGASQGLTGKVYEALIFNGATSTIVADPQFYNQTAGASSFTDAQGNTWQNAFAAELSNRSYRFHGECSSLPQSQDPTGTDIWTPVTASGILRRLSQGSANLWSPMRRADQRLGNVAAYWPCEDLAGAAQIASGLPGGSPMNFTGTPQLAADSSSFVCSNALPYIESSSWTGQVPVYTATALVLRGLVNVPASEPAGGSGLLLYATCGNAVGAVCTLWIGVDAGNIIATAGNFNGLSGNTVTGPAVGSGPIAISAEVYKSGANYYLNLYWMTPGQPVMSQSGQVQLTWATSISPANSIYANLPSAPAAWASTTLGHIQVLSDTTVTLTDMAPPLAAWAGETAANRFARLCSENSIASRIYGFPGLDKWHPRSDGYYPLGPAGYQSVVMGPQQIDTLANVLQSCEDGDHGQIYEPSECFGLGYRTLASMINQAQNVAGAPLQLSWSAADLGDGSQMVGVTDDDQFTVNDMTATRNNGSSYQLQLNDGSPLSISPPPAGVGDYAQTVTLYLNADTQLPDAAAWLVHVGTCDESRFPLIPLALTRTQLAALIYQIQNVRLGGYLQVTGPPSYLTPNTIRQIASGTTEQLGGFHYNIAWQCAPETPYETIVLNDANYGRVNTDGSTLASGASSTATSLSVATTNASSPLWTTKAGAFPFYVNIAGEQIQVTNITGSSSPQTFTVVRSQNGVVKAQSAAAAVSLWYPTTLALT